MQRINWNRVLIGGLVAGLVLNAGGMILAHVVFGTEYVRAVSAKMISRPLWQVMTQNLGLRFWLGIVGVFLYAAMRSRFGRGPRTAFFAGLALFLSAGVVMINNLYSLGVLDHGRLAISILWSAGEFVVAMIVGSWIYRERSF